MKKWQSKLMNVCLIVALSSSIYFYFHQSKVFEYFFKFGENYIKEQDEQLVFYKERSIVYDTEYVAEQLQKTRNLAQDIFKKNFSTHDLLPIFVTVPGNKGHDKMEAASGLYLYKMNVILINGEKEQFTSYTTIHEYSHFLFNLYVKDYELSLDEIPDWFTEGFAEYMAFRVDQAFPMEQTYAYNVQPFDTLDELNQTNVNAIYLQGFYAIYDLIEKNGVEMIPTVIQAYKKTRDFGRAFEEVTNESYASYHKQFRLNENKLTQLTRGNRAAQKVKELGEKLLENHAQMNPYSPFVLPYVVAASLEVNEIDDAKAYFGKLDQLLFNPNDYRYYATLFSDAGEKKFAEELMEKAHYYAKVYHYDE